MNEYEHNIKIPQEIFVLIGLWSLQRTRRNVIRAKNDNSGMPKKTPYSA